MLKQLIEVFKAYAGSIGLPDWIANDVVFILLLLGLVATLVCKAYQLIGKIILFKNQMILKRDLAPYNYALSDVRRATRYYIPTRYQNVSPSEDEEPGRNYIASAKNKLIPLFLKELFPLSKADNKYYLILADTGMGKTTFLINLYLAYKTKINLPFSVRKFDIKLYPVWHPNTFADIAGVADKANTILLLDAFDEDVQAVENYKERLSELLSIVNRFRVVVLTCRTQFFPSQKEEPHETGYFTGGEKGEYLFQKLYLSTFSMKDISRYLKKRYSLIFSFGRYRKAKRIINACPTLVVRPMLLYYIDDLLKIAKEVPYAYQIYEQLIAEWIRRESTKYSTRKKYEELQLFGIELRNFSQQLAIDLYEKRAERSGYFLPANTDFAAGLLKMSELEHEKLFDERDAKSKSLLNRNAAGDYKFSHKSILEYFLAREMFQQLTFFERFDFKGMDAAKRFLTEMIIHKMKEEEGHYFMDEKRKELGNLTMEMIKQVKEISCDSISIAPGYFTVFENLKVLTYKSTHQIISFIRFRYIVSRLSAVARQGLTLIDETSIRKEFDFGNSYSSKEKGSIIGLISILNSIKQEVLPFAHIFELIRGKELFLLQKVFRFNESYNRLPDLISTMISAIDECVALLRITSLESARKNMPFIIEAVTHFKDWLEWRSRADSMDMIVSHEGFLDELISERIPLSDNISGPDKREKIAEQILILDGLVADIFELEVFLPYLEQFALKMPGARIRFESPVPDRKTIGITRDVVISWNLLKILGVTAGEHLFEARRFPSLKRQKT